MYRTPEGHSDAIRYMLTCSSSLLAHVEQQTHREHLGLILPKGMYTLTGGPYRGLLQGALTGGYYRGL